MTLAEIFAKAGFEIGQCAEAGLYCAFKRFKSADGRSMLFVLTGAGGAPLKSQEEQVHAGLYEVSGPVPGAKGALELLVSDEFPDLGTAFDAIVEPPWMEPS